jgi:N-acetylneuraminic acid mutarotase
MILLSDGRVMVQEEATQHWHALSPDIHGSYVNGAWSPLADMSFWRRYYASGILKDGRIVIIGGEQSGAGGDTNATRKKLRWSRLSEQIFRFDKWGPCRG